MTIFLAYSLKSTLCIPPQPCCNWAWELPIILCEKYNFFTIQAKALSSPSPSITIDFKICLTIPWGLRQ